MIIGKLARHHRRAASSGVTSMVNGGSGMKPLMLGTKTLTIIMANYLTFGAHPPHHPKEIWWPLILLH